MIAPTAPVAPAAGDELGNAGRGVDVKGVTTVRNSTVGNMVQVAGMKMGTAVGGFGVEVPTCLTSSFSPGWRTGVGER